MTAGFKGGLFEYKYFSHLFCAYIDKKLYMACGMDFTYSEIFIFGWKYS